MTSKNNKNLQISCLFFGRTTLWIVCVCFGLNCITQMIFAQITVGPGEQHIVNDRKTEEVSSVDFDGDGGTVLVTGEGSTLIVTGTPGKTDQGFLAVTGSGTLVLNNTGKIAFDGNALFDKGYLIQQAGTLLDVTDGRIVFGNGSVVSSAGTLIAGDGVHVKSGSVLNVLGANGTLLIKGGDLEFSDTSTLGITLNASRDAGRIEAANNVNVILKGSLLVTPEYGYYTTPHKFAIIESNAGTISGDFDNVSLINARLGTITTDGTDPNAFFMTFTPSTTPYSNFTRTFNEHSVGETFDEIHRLQLPNFLPLMQETWTKSDAELRTLYNGLSGEIRAETMAMPLVAPGRMAFDRVTWDSATGHVAFGPQYRLAASGSRRAAWVRPYYIGDKVESDGNASRYTRDGYGFVGGLDQTLTGGRTAVGVMLGYGRPELKTRNDKAKLDDFLIGAYFATRILNTWEIKCWGGYGYQYYDMQRHLKLLGTPQTFKSNFKGSTGTVSGELSRPIYTNSRLVLKPTVGYDGLFLKQDATDETGNTSSYPVALSYHKTNIERHIGRIGLNAEYGDSARSLYGGAHYKYLLGGDPMYYSQAAFAGGGPALIVHGVDLGKAFISGNIGLQINLADDRSRLFFVDYTADFGDHSAFFQMATVGLQQTF